jgi:hypothetical protein
MDDAGRAAEVHALRHTYITRVVSSGATVRVAQDLARQSSPTLTISRYAHTRLYDLSAALDGIPDTDGPTENDIALKDIATDNVVAESQPHNPRNRHSNAAQNTSTDVELETIVNAWPNLPAWARDSIMNIAKGTIQDS